MVLFNDWWFFERQIKDFKEGVTIDNIEKNEKCSINCSIFKKIFKPETDINSLVNNYNKNIKDSTLILNVILEDLWVIQFPYDIVFNYMKIQADSICKKITEITNEKEINTIILVGGYCYNDVITNLIKNGQDKIKTFLQPSNPSLAVVEGAVLFGIDPGMINIRKAEYTIGERVDSTWIDVIHSEGGDRYFNKTFNKWICRNCFYKFIEINQDIAYDQIINQESYINEGQRAVIFEFFKTKKQNPIFSSEEDVIKLGECLLDLGKIYKNLEDRKIKTTMKFGGTFIDVTAIHLKSGKSVKTTLKFN